MNDDGAGFGARLRASRQSAGLSQDELAHRSGMSVRAISNLERDRVRWPYRETVRRLADALELRDAARAEFTGAAGRRLPSSEDAASAGRADDGSGQADSGRLVPRQLPAPVREFTGRGDELAALTGLLPQGGGSPPALVIAAVIAHMTQHGWPGHATRFAAAVYPYLEVFGRTTEAITICDRCLEAARSTGDRGAEAVALGNLGYVRLLQDDYHQAARDLQQALSLFRQAGDRAGEALAVGNLAVVDRRQGRYQQAADNQRQALTLYRQVGDPWGLALALTRLAAVECGQGCLPEATGHLRQARMSRPAPAAAWPAPALRWARPTTHVTTCVQRCPSTPPSALPRPITSAPSSTAMHRR
ncbi:MAG: tetratricopeptide repeat protein [Streptosporangiaceae bacterium]